MNGFKEGMESNEPITTEQVMEKINQIKVMAEKDKKGGGEFAGGLENELTGEDMHVQARLTELFGDDIKSLPEYQALTGSAAVEPTEPISEERKQEMLKAIDQKLDALLQDWDYIEVS